MTASIALLGGTFDPVHFGHLRIALEVKQLLPVDEMRLVPCNAPGHRVAPQASAAQRLDMLRMAVADDPDLLVDDREILRGGVSYTVDTLASLREEFGASVPLVLVLGMDSFLTLESWYEWQKIPDLAHLMVVTRPGSSLPGDDFHERIVRARSTEAVEDLVTAPHGRIMIKQLSLLDISASQIRHLVHCGRSPRYLLPDRIIKFIDNSKLYQ